MSEPTAATETDYAPLHTAVAVIAANCDGAVSDDGMGFNGADTAFGHRAAATDPQGWTPNIARRAWSMLRKYSRQLSAAGIDYADLPVPPEPKASDGAYLKLDVIDGEQVLVLVRPVFDAGLVADCKAVRGRRYRDPAIGVSGSHRKANTFPLAAGATVVEIADRYEVPVDDEVRDLAANAPESQVVEPEPNITLHPSGRFKVVTEYDRELNEHIKRVAPWDKSERCRWTPLVRGPELAVVAGDWGLSISDEAQAAIDVETARRARNLADESATTCEPVDVPGLVDGVSLLPHQHVAVRFAGRNRRHILGDTMGLGKTLESLAALATNDGLPAVVACKPDLTGNWCAEVRKFFPHLTAFVATGTKPGAIPAGTDIVIVGYAVLKAWTPTLTAWRPAGLVIDEGHLGRNQSAQRSKALATLGADVASRDGLVISLTGTAIVNRPLDLLQQLATIGRLEDLGGEWEFKFRYCGPKRGEFGWTFAGASHLDELHTRLVELGIWLRRGKDVLGLPECTTETWLIEREALDARAMRVYERAERDLADKLRRELDAARRRAREAGADTYAAARQEFLAALRRKDSQYLILLTRLREFAAAAKRPAVTAWVSEKVAAGEKVMVAAHHRAEVDHYADRFGGLRIQGGQSVESKEADKARFQAEPASSAPVISVSIGAGGLGHTLTAARLGIQAEMPWTPAEEDQMRDRLHRIGQTREVTYVRALAAGTIDVMIDQRVGGKRAIADVILDGLSEEERDAMYDPDAYVVPAVYAVAWALAGGERDDDAGEW